MCLFHFGALFFPSLFTRLEAAGSTQRQDSEKYSKVSYLMRTSESERMEGGLAGGKNRYVPEEPSQSLSIPIHVPTPPSSMTLALPPPWSDRVPRTGLIRTYVPMYLSDGYCDQVSKYIRTFPSVRTSIPAQQVGPLSVMCSASFGPTTRSKPSTGHLSICYEYGALIQTSKVHKIYWPPFPPPTACPLSAPSRAVISFLFPSTGIVRERLLPDTSRTTSYN